MNFALTDAFAELKRDYIAGAFERLDLIETILGNLQNGAADPEADYVELSRHIHSMKGSAGVYGFMSVTVIAHHLEDYLAASDGFAAATLHNVQIYLDRIRDIYETGDNPSDEATADILRHLPTAGPPSDADAADVGGAMVLLVMEKGVLRDMTAAAVSKARFKLSQVDTTLEAIQLIVTGRPDAVISSMEFPYMSGADLARAVFAMKSTAHIPFVLMTSHAPGSAALADLPSGTHLIKKGHDANAALVAQLKTVCG